MAAVLGGADTQQELASSMQLVVVANENTIRRPLMVPCSSEIQILLGH